MQIINKAKNVILHDFPENGEEEDKKFVLDALDNIPTSFDNISYCKISQKGWKNELIMGFS